MGKPLTESAVPPGSPSAKAHHRSRKIRFQDVLGPGLVAGASDDDPSGIATYSQAGAQFAYGLGWTMVLTYPLMCAVQIISARIGRTTGHGIAGNLRRHYPRPLTLSFVGLLLVANTINLGADLGAMGDATAQVFGGLHWLYLILFGVFYVVSELMMGYRSYVRVLKWLSLALLAYVATLFLVHVRWPDALRGAFIPQPGLGSGALMTIVALFGTTLSPYVFFWQALEEAEDVKEIDHRPPLERDPKSAPHELRRIELDTFVGMAASNLVALAIIITAAATLNAHGITHVETSADAAEALKPIAGSQASLVFALGIVGTGLLAVPVLADSAAYAVCEALHLPAGLQRKPLRAKAFYGTIVTATALGAAMNFTPIKPIQALYLAAVINGVVAAPVMAVMMLMASRSAILGDLTIGRSLKLFGWLATGVMTVAVVGMGWSLIA